MVEVKPELDNSYHGLVRLTIHTTESITGTSTSTPTTVASAAPAAGFGYGSGNFLSQNVNRRIAGIH